LNTLQALAIIGTVAIALGVSVFVPVTTSGPTGTSPLPSGVAATGDNGLQLRLSLNATQISPGQSIGIDMSVFNTLSSTNNVSASTLTPFNVQTGACPNQVYPFGVAVFQGRYFAGNVSQGTPLQIFPPTPCPMFIRYISGYVFQPNSNAAVILPGGNGSSSPMSTNVTVGQTFGGVAQSAVLSPGLYTVAAADEWGVAVFLYVQVS
jgi:hypothetical protein